MPSQNLTSAAAFRAYVETIAEEAVSKGFFGFDSAALMTTHEGIKGKLVLTLLNLGTIGRRWTKTFAPIDNTIEFVPRELEVNAGTFELSFVPQEFESSYLGFLRTNSFNNIREIPFEAYILDKVLSKMSNELGVAIWRGVKTGSAATDPLTSLVNGFLKIITDAVTATTLTPVVTAGGAITATNAVATIENVFDALDSYTQAQRCAAFVSPATYKKYQQDYRERYGKYTDNAQSGRTMLDFAEVELIRTPEMGTSNRVIITEADNLHYGTDGTDDFKNFNFEQNKRTVEWFADFKFGCQIGLLQNGVIAINDLA